MNRCQRLLLLVILPALLAMGCARAPAPTSTVRVAVLDSVPVGEAAETRHAIAGWWLGSHDRFDNGNAGRHIGDALAREFDQLPGVSVYSRIDLDVYLAQKERMLRRAYPDLEPEERVLLLEAQDPLDYGRSLNVDYVLSSELLRSRTSHNRTFHWWKSGVQFKLTLWEVADGKPVWFWEGDDTDLFDSQLAVIEELAREGARAAKKQDAFGIYPNR